MVETRHVRFNLKGQKADGNYVFRHAAQPGVVAAISKKDKHKQKPKRQINFKVDNDSGSDEGELSESRTNYVTKRESDESKLTCFAIRRVGRGVKLRKSTTDGPSRFTTEIIVES